MLYMSVEKFAGGGFIAFVFDISDAKLLCIPKGLKNSPCINHCAYYGQGTCVTVNTEIPMTC